MSICLVKQPPAEFDGYARMSHKMTQWAGLRSLTSRWVEWRRRRSLTRLLDLNTRLIDDMGLTREEICAARALPLSENAIELMHERAARRRKEDFAALRRRKPIMGLKQW